MHITNEQVKEVSHLVARYIHAQRDKYEERAVSLSPSQKLLVKEYFSVELIGSVRVLELSNEKVSTPDFYPLLEMLGFNNLPNQSSMAAITFNDVVVSHEPFSPGLLFHELVHVEQYRQLGVDRFAELYVRGFLNGGGYDSIPLEINAYVLGGRFETNPKPGFSVALEIEKWIREGRF